MTGTTVEGNRRSTRVSRVCCQPFEGTSILCRGLHVCAGRRSNRTLIVVLPKISSSLFLTLLPLKSGPANSSQQPQPQLDAARFSNLVKRRQIREALGSEREALLSQLTEQMVSGIENSGRSSRCRGCGLHIEQLGTHRLCVRKKTRHATSTQSGVTSHMTTSYIPSTCRQKRYESP